MAIRYAIICDQKNGLDSVIERNLNSLAESNPKTQKVMDEVIKERIFEANIKSYLGEHYIFSPEQPGTTTKMKFYKLGPIWVADMEFFNKDDKLFYHELIDWEFRLNKLKQRNYEYLKKFVLGKYNLSKSGEIVSIIHNM